MLHNSQSALTFPLSGLILVSLLTLVAPASASTVIYRETFGNTKGANTTFSDTANILTDWNVYSTSTGVKGTSFRPIVSSVANSPGAGGLPNIGTGYTETTQSNGVVYTDVSSVNWLFATTGHAGNLINMDPAQGLTFSWYQGDASAADDLRVAVQVGGSWYVTTTTFSTPALGSTALTSQSWTFTNDASQWYALNFTTGSTLSIDTTALTGTLPSGNITGFGVYVDPNASYVRFDNFSVISAVPEPSSAALLVGFSLLQGWRSIRRKKI